MDPGREARDQPAAVIRHGRATEVEPILAMYEWLWAPPGRRPSGLASAWAGTALSGAIDSEDAAVLVAEAERDEIVGLCTAYLDLDSVRFGRRCWVEDLAVHPERRSRGIGARLLGAARDWARERGATHLELDTGPARVDAQRFYERERPSSRSLGYGWQL